MKFYQNNGVIIASEAIIDLPEVLPEEVEKGYDENWYLIGTAPKEPTLEEKVARLEAETGLTRIMREMVLAENSGASDYAKAKAREIEDLAAELRTAEKASEVEEVVISEKENTTWDL